MIDFEKDQQEVIKKTGNIQSLADQVERLESMQKQIEIQEEAKGLDLANTLLHEVIHAIVYHSSLNAQGGPLHDDDHEEQAVNSVTNWMMTVLRDNPWFLETIKQSIAEDKEKDKKK